VVPLYNELYRVRRAILETPDLLAELVRLVRSETHHARILSHEVQDMRRAAVEALTFIATGGGISGREVHAVLRVLMNEEHPLTDPDRLARAVMLGSPGFADEVMKVGYEQAAKNIGAYIDTLAEAELDRDIFELYKRRVETMLHYPGLVVATGRPKPSPEALKAAGYSLKPGTVYVPPYRGMPDEKLYRLAEALCRPTSLQPLPPPENVLANMVAASIIQAVLENRYTMVAYAAADVLAGGGPMTVFGPIGKPLLMHGGVTSNLNEALDLVEQLFTAAGHKVKKSYLANYFERVRSIVVLGEELAGGVVHTYDLRGFYEARGGEFLENVRQEVRHIISGRGAEEPHLLIKGESDPMKPLSMLQLYINASPYLTQRQLNLLERMAALIVTLTITPERGAKDRVNYMAAKVRKAREMAGVLTRQLIPVQAYTPTGGPKSLERVTWAVMVRHTLLPGDEHPPKSG
jgi:hypothetical protein